MGGLRAQSGFQEPEGWLPENDFDPCKVEYEFIYLPSTELTLCEEFPNYIPTPGFTIANGTTTNYGPNELIENKNFLVNGLWTINASNSLIFRNCNFKMASGALISLNGNNTNTMTYESCNFFSCDQVWRGINVSHQFTQVDFAPNTFNFTDCHIEDAVSALYFRNPSLVVTYNITGNFFNNNYVGLRAFKDAITLTPQWMSLFFSENNLGTTQNLRPFYGPKPPPLGWPLAYAGVQIGKLTTFIGQPNSTNSFYRMTNGVFCENSVLTILGNNFNTLWTNGILGISSNLTVGGNEFIGEVSIPGGSNPPVMENGIFGLSSDLDIQYNTFDKRIRYGINARENQHGEFIKIEQNSFSEDVNANFTTEHCGICIERSAAALSPGMFSHNEIYLNNFNIKSPFYTAIVVEGANTASDELHVSRNFPIQLDKNSSSFFNPVKGIYVRTMNGENTNIAGNHVDIAGEFSSGNFGILTFTSNAVNFSIRDNIVNGALDPPPGDPNFPYNTEAAIFLRNADNANAKLCNNATDNTLSGFHFFSGMAEMRENKIFNHKHGVKISPYNILPMLGLQDGRGNQWLGNYSKFAAIREGGFFPENCRFWVPESDLLPFLPPSNLISPNPDLEPDANKKWFRYRPTLPTDYCSGEPIPLGINEFEMKVAEGLFTDLPAVKIWDVKRNLFRKLLEDPELLLGDSILLAFKSFYQGSLLDTFSQVDVAIRNATRLTTLHQASRDSTILSINEKENQIDTLLAAVTYDLRLASSTQLQSLANLELQISTYFSNRSALDQARDLLIITNLDAANVLNEALFPTNVQEQTRKDLNRLIIKKLRPIAGDTIDYQSALTIAAQPDTVVGAALQEAILLLSGCDQNEFLSQGVDSRETTSIPSQPNLPEKFLKVSPNPSSGYFEVQLIKHIGGALNIVNTSGRLIKKIELSPEQHNVSVNLSGQPIGVYFLTLQSTEGDELETQRIIIH